MSDEKPVGETLETVAEKIGSLSKSVEVRFASVDARFDAVDRRFDAVDRRFDAVDRRCDAVDRRFDEVTEALVEQRQYTEFAFEKLRGEMNGGFGRLDRKLDRILDNLPKMSPPRRRRRS